ncbi:MAG: DinB family protein [Vicinamibacterales bacterium]
MKPLLSIGTFVTLLSVLAVPATAQTREGLMGDLLKDIGEVESKVVGLAKAMPEGTYSWRPSPGVRSVAEVLAHVASDNYFLPAAMGVAPPTETGINGKDVKTAAAFEKRSMTRDQVIAEVSKSFAFLKTSMTGVTDAELNGPIELFGQKTTNRSMWITTATHLHEHLGQLIAYARSNKVTPPWSK